MTAKQDRQFGRRLRVARIALGISGQEAADAHGITLATYRRREAGKPWLSMRPLLEYRFTSARMAKDYVSTYRRLLKTGTSRARPRQAALNGGNGSAPISIEKPFAALFEAGADPEIPI
jgi:transcriptional regulator with XRE-family HTH domain